MYCCLFGLDEDWDRKKRGGNLDLADGQFDALRRCAEPQTHQLKANHLTRGNLLEISHDDLEFVLDMCLQSSLSESHQHEVALKRFGQLCRSLRCEANSNPLFVVVTAGACSQNPTEDQHESRQNTLNSGVA